MTPELVERWRQECLREAAECWRKAKDIRTSGPGASFEAPARAKFIEDARFLESTSAVLRCLKRAIDKDTNRS